MKLGEAQNLGPVTVTYDWTVAEFERATRHAKRRLGMTRLKKGLAWFYGTFPLLFVALVMALDLELREYAYQLGIGTLVVAWIFYFKWKARRDLASSPVAGREVRVTISDGGVRSEVTGLGSEEWSWDAVKEAEDTADGLLIFSTTRGFIWMPGGAFASATDRRRALEIATRHAKT